MLKNYFKDWSNHLSFAIALVPTILLYIYPSGTKVPFFRVCRVAFLFCIITMAKRKIFSRFKR